MRAVSRQHFMPWFEEHGADVIALQEIKATREQVDPKLWNPRKYHSFWNPAQKPGYSGTAIYTKQAPLEVRYGIGRKDTEEFDREGRILELEFKDFTLLNCYFPNSQRDHARLDYKLRFCDAILKHCERLRKKGKHVILCGDFNIAHQEIDLRNPKSNQDNAGFLPEERAWMTKFLGAGYVDTFRKFTPDPHHYTWWSYRPGVRAKNVGWRLDYFCVNEEFAGRLKAVRHQPDQMGSDHCPVELTLKK